MLDFFKKNYLIFNSKNISLKYSFKVSEQVESLLELFLQNTSYSRSVSALFKSSLLI